MKLDIFLQRTTNLFTENRLLKFVVVVLTVGLLLNSLMTYQAIQYQRTVLIPPTMTGTIEFVKGRPTDTYLRDMARRIVNLAATYTPVTARAQFDELLAHFHPEDYPQAQATWYTLAGRIEEALVTSAFYPQRITIGDERLEITGQHRQWADDRMVDSGTKSYVARYRIEDGRFYLLSLMELGQERQLQRGQR